ncbi:MAG: hypothetical protein ACR2GW_04075 [Pyrinomonadaceae bacterium]
MAQGLICNGTNTRALRVLPNVAPFNALAEFVFAIRVRGMRVAHPTRQRLIVAPGIALSIEGGELRFTTTNPGGGDLSLPLGGATDGEARLDRLIDYNNGTATFTLRFTRRTGELVGLVANTVPYIGGFNIAGGAGLSIAADNTANAENLQCSVDDFRFIAGGRAATIGHPLPHGPDTVRYGFPGNGNDALPGAQHLTVENGAYELTPEVLAVAADDARATFSGITPEPGFLIRLFERTQDETFNYSRPLRENIISLPRTIEGRTNKMRFFYVARLHNEITGTDGADSNEVGLLPPVPPAAAGESLITFDEFFVGADPSAMSVQPGPQPIAGDRYRAQGVLISIPGGPVINPWDRSHTPWGGLSSGGVANQPVTLDFVVPNTTTPGRTGAVSFFVCGTEPGQTATWRAVAYTSAGVALQTIEGTTDAEVVFTRAQGDISRIIFTPTAGHELLDTLRFNTPVAV